MSARREAMARQLLDGVGDATLGEWVEDAPRAFHLRCRLTADEAEGIAPVVDVRGTPEATARARAVAIVAPIPREWVEDPR